MLRSFKEAFLMLVALTLVTGVVYPLLVTGIAKSVFPGQAEGSLIERNGKIVGSALIGQPFSDPKYFWSRPSATAPMPYNAGASSGSNQGPLNPALAEAVKAASRRCAPPTPTTRHRYRSISSPPPPAASTRTSARPRPTTRSRGSQRCAVSTQRKYARSSPSTPRAASSASSASRG